MFRLILAAAGAAAAVAAASAAMGQTPSMPYANQPFPPGDYSHSQFSNHDRAHIKNRLKALHDEAVATQKADGGALSPEHRAELEAKLAVLRQEACDAGMGC